MRHWQLLIRFLRWKVSKFRRYETKEEIAENINAKLQFTTRSGELFVEKVEEGKHAMDFPAFEAVPLNEHPQWRDQVPQYVHDIAKVRKYV